MASVRERSFPAGQGREANAFTLGLEQLQRLQRVVLAVQRHRWFVLGVAVTVDEGGVFLLDVTAVGQQNGAQIAGGGCGVYTASVALAVEQRQVAAVV